MSVTTPSPDSARPVPRPPAAELGALAAALAGEHAAIYAYGVVGGQAGDAYRRASAERIAAHSVQRDLLAAELSAAGTPPAAGAPAYTLPFAVRSVGDALRLAVHVEHALAATYVDLVAAAAPTRRARAAARLTDCAEQAHAWGAEPQAFPGLPERAVSR